MTAFGPGHGRDEQGRAAARRVEPPARALAWVSRQRGGAFVERCEVLRGGTSSAMHVVTLRHGDGRIERVVLRRYVLPADPREPDVAAREAAALGVVDGIAVPTPTLLGSDLTGAEADVPALLMTELAGRPVWEPSPRRRWCRALAEAIVAVHEAVVPPSAAIPAYVPHPQRSYAVPRWARDTSVWERAIEVAHEPTIDAPGCFIHRDLHPGNVLWNRSELTGLVDWQHASIGPAVVDVGHNRLNLFFSDEALAELFTSTWENVAGAAYDPWADIVAIIGALDHLRDGPPPSRARETIERALAAALSSTGA